MGHKFTTVFMGKMTNYSKIVKMQMITQLTDGNYSHSYFVVEKEEGFL
jgi:hypothetical protein